MPATADVNAPRPPRGLNGLLSHIVKKARIRQALPEIADARKILDIGAGLCEIVNRIPPAASYTAIERDPWMARRATDLFPRHRIIEADVERDEIGLGAEFDAILLIAVWEHFRDPAGFLDRARKWLEHDGTLVLTTPSPAAHRLIDIGSALRLLSSSAAEEHEKLWSIGEIRRVAREKGWRVEKARRFLMGLNQIVVLRPGTA